MTLNELKIFLNLMKISEKAIMMKVMKDIFLKLMFNIPKVYITFTLIHTFCLKKIKIEKVEKLVANLCDKNEYVIHIRNLEQALNHRLVLKQVHRIIKSNQKAWLKPHINMNTDPRNKAKMILKKYFLS